MIDFSDKTKEELLKVIEVLKIKEGKLCKELSEVKAKNRRLDSINLNSMRKDDYNKLPLYGDFGKNEPGLLLRGNREYIEDDGQRWVNVYKIADVDHEMSTVNIVSRLIQLVED